MFFRWETIRNSEGKNTRPTSLYLTHVYNLSQKKGSNRDIQANFHRPSIKPRCFSKQRVFGCFRLFSFRANNFRSLRRFFQSSARAEKRKNKKRKISTCALTASEIAQTASDLDRLKFRVPESGFADPVGNRRSTARVPLRASWTRRPRRRPAAPSRLCLF